jgi:hypothetical protein
MIDLIIYQEKHNGTAEEELMDLLNDLHLSHLASELFVYGFTGPDELSASIERSMNICRNANISIRQNFKPLYVYRNGEMLRDWRLSDLGRKLVILNGDSKNPFVAKLQIQLLKNFKI